MAPGELARAVVQRFRLSQIESEHLEHAGAVTRRGASVTLVASAPTKPFRLVPVAGSHPTLQQVMDFAGVDIAADGAVQTESTLLRAPAGTEMVILDVRVGPDVVHLFAHTAAPLPVSLEGDAIYGCTEFVFHFDPTTLASPESLTDRIGEWLSRPTGVHECRDDVEPLCIEP
ncbi:MAG: hypothetical protein DME09_10500 [Candidatus Rokuibacteriota bacterium]|nr:MAG: hypothetical protein DME09_10500 [Candidatus Rokubacteria bacterium]